VFFAFIFFGETQMDPTGCFLDMFAAMHDDDRETAREYALSLRDWLNQGGFYPHGFTEAEVIAYLASVLRKTANLNTATASHTNR